MHRRLVMELGRSEAPGRPILFGTGFDFLERFGLTSLDQLPPLEASVAERLFVEPDEELAADVPLVVATPSAVDDVPGPDEMDRDAGAAVDVEPGEVDSEEG
jgi:hypothetical protein